MQFIIKMNIKIPANILFMDLAICMSDILALVWLLAHGVSSHRVQHWGSFCWKFSHNFITSLICKVSINNNWELLCQKTMHIGFLRKLSIFNWNCFLILIPTAHRGCWASLLTTLINKLVSCTYSILSMLITIVLTVFYVNSSRAASCVSF